MTNYDVFQLGDFELSSGTSLRGAFIAYKTFGDSSKPAIIYPTWFSGLISDNEWLIGDDKALDPARYYIIVPAMFGNGQSSSPSNSALLKSPVEFPRITVRDNVTAHYRLVTEHLGVQHARLVLGWSMGAMQTYQWLTQYPDFMDLAVPFCGSARTSVHNQVFLEGVKVALLAARGASSAGSANGEAAVSEGGVRGWTDGQREVGLKAMGRVYAGWGFSQDFYRHELYRKELGYKSLEDFMIGFWESWALSKDPENLLSMIWTWQDGDCSRQTPFNGDFELAMRSIKAKTLVLPGLKDLYFPPEDSEYEVKCMTFGTGKCIPIPSLYGHWAGGPGTNPVDAKWLDDKLKGFLADGQLPLDEGASTLEANGDDKQLSGLTKRLNL